MSLQCRSCLSLSAAEYIALTSPMNKECTYLDGFQQCTQIQAKPTESMCASCAEMVQKFFQFIQMSKRADYFLRDQITKVQVEDSVKEKEQLTSVDECLEMEGDQIDVMVNDVAEYSQLEVLKMDDTNKPIILENRLLKAPKEIDMEYLQTDDANDNDEIALTVSYEELDDEYIIEFEGSESESTNASVQVEKWECMVCHKILRGDVSYEGHMNMHKNVRPHKCAHCELAFRCKKSLRRHMENQHQTTVVPKRFKCKTCEKVFSLKNLLEEHERLEHTYTCTTCAKNFNDNAELENHLTLAHSKLPNSVFCPYCTCALMGDKLLEHIRIFHQIEYSKYMLPEPNTETKWKCDVCLNFFCSSYVLEDHKSVHIPGTLYECHICSNRYTTIGKLKTHMDTAHNQRPEESDESTLVRCEVCRKEIMAKDLVEHKAIHEKKNLNALKNGRKFLCSYCPFECKSQSTLIRHESIHENNKTDTEFNCPECDRKYPTQLFLDQHMKNAHKSRDHVCPLCGNAFKLKNQLNNHMKLHLEKNIQCPHCEKKFARTFDLNIHLRSHTGEKPYTCNICGKKFAVKVRLTYHLQQHEGVKHRCKQCGSEFTSKNKLRFHSYKHTGMPYRCDLCDDHGFSNRVSFRSHYMRVHNAEMSDEALAEMFHRNTGKTVRIKTIEEMAADGTNKSIELLFDKLEYC